MIEPFPNYSYATNTAYSALIAFHQFTFPISMRSVLRKMSNVAVHSYSEMARRFHMSFEEFYSTVSSEYGFSSRMIGTNNYELLYNDRKDLTTIRFTLAHELGHILLGHNVDEPKENKEANCFARNFLCPIPAITEFKIDSIHDYTNTFYVSEPMAEIAIKLKKADYRNITSYNYWNYYDNVSQWHYGISLRDMYGDYA